MSSRCALHAFAGSGEGFNSEWEENGSRFVTVVPRKIYVGCLLLDIRLIASVQSLLDSLKDWVSRPILTVRTSHNLYRVYRQTQSAGFRSTGSLAI